MTYIKGSTNILDKPFSNIFLSLMNIQSTTYTSRTKEYFQLAAFSLLCFFAFTHNLNEIPPYHADENFYVTSTRNMVDSGDYITPMYHDKKRFAKPVLFYWLVAASYKTFGINLFSARLVSAFFGTLCIPLVYILARRMFDGRTAIISALLLPGCYLHFQIARWAITDMTMNFFVMLAFYFFIRGLQDKSDQNTPYCLAYLCMGIGFMIKGPPAILIPALGVGGFILILRDWEKLTQLRLGYGTVILLAIILPWFVTMLNIHGDEFKNHILGAELRDRMVHDIPFSFYYFGVTLRYYLPWSLFFIAALAVRFGFTSIIPSETSSEKRYFASLPGKLKIRYRELTEEDNQPFLFCVLWILGPLLLFTLFRIEHSRYMLPVSPAIAMITAHFLSQLIDSPNSFQQRIFKIPFYLTIIFYFLIITVTGAAVLALNPAFPVSIALMVQSTLGLCMPALIFLLYKSRKYFPMTIALAVIQIIILTSLSGDALSFFNRHPMKAFSMQILADPQTDKRIGLYQLGSHRARMGVLTGLPSLNLNNPEEVTRFIQSGKNIYIVMRQSDWQNKFSDLHLVLQSTDSGWKKSHMDQDKINKLLEDGLKPHLKELSENYVLLTAGNQG